MNSDYRDDYYGAGPAEICPVCGTPNEPGSRFCINCGSSLEKRKKNRRPVLIALILILLAAAAAFITYQLLDSDDSVGSGSDTESSREADSDDGEDAGSSGGFSMLEEADAAVLSSDWDWDSSWYDTESGTYVVDAILYVRNDSDLPIVRIDFTVQSKDWSEIANGLDPDEDLSAWGYIEPGSKGVMVGQIHSTEKKVRPVDDTYNVSAVYTNDALGDYTIPRGKVTKKYGPNGDYYDISLDNPNDIPVDSSSIIVMVNMSGSDIRDADATGKIDGSIPPDTRGFAQEIAFNDPNLYSEPEDMVVYAIDTKTYEQKNTSNKTTHEE